KLVLILLFQLSCAHHQAPPTNNEVSKDFSRSELILSTQLLTKIYDMEMAPISCVDSVDEASLLLRTIRPRLEIVQDDLEAVLDSPQEVDQLLNTCRQECTCTFIDDLLREHQVTLT